VGYPTRTCIACRRPAAKPTLRRLAAVDGTVQVDPLVRLPGRGAYVCDRQECVEVALRDGGAAVARALRGGRDAIDAEALAAALAPTARRDQDNEEQR
jgi:predicted RNA-binding protein YlxR (DUF448 family)